MNPGPTDSNFHPEYAQGAQPSPVTPKRGRLFFVTSSLLFFVLGIVITSQFYTAFMPTANGEALDKLMTVYHLIKEEWYFGEEDTEEVLLERALQAMVNDQNDDAYLRYYPPPVPSGEEPEFQDPQYGIGVEVIAYDGYLRIQKVYSNSPASYANLQVGDVIVTVDGTNIRYDSLENVSEQIQGDNETTVVLGVLRSGVNVEVTIVRGSYRADTVYARPFVAEGYGLLMITGFQDDTLGHVNAALSLFEDAGLDRLIIDVRDNPGGYVMVFTQIADLFLERDSIYGRYVYRDDQLSYNLKAETAARYSFDKIVFLINGNSASAAESLTASMCDNLAHCIVAGETSYGKGIAQKTISFDDGSSLKYTYAEFIRKDGTKLHGVGVEPDVELALQGPHQIFNRTEIVGDTYEARVQDFLLALEYEGATLTDLLEDLQTKTSLPVTGQLDEPTIAKIAALRYDAEWQAKQTQLQQAVTLLLEEGGA